MYRSYLWTACRKWLDFHRSSRQEFFGFFAESIALYFFIDSVCRWLLHSSVVTILLLPSQWEFWGPHILVTYAYPILFYVWITLLLMVRRLHDFDWSGWWLFLAPLFWFVPWLAPLVGLIPGDMSSNCYGPVPTHASATWATLNQWLAQVLAEDVD